MAPGGVWRLHELKVTWLVGRFGVRGCLNDCKFGLEFLIIGLESGDAGQERLQSSLNLLVY